jgi:hypothetical protein
MTAYIQLEADDLDRVVDRVRGMGPGNGGYVQSSSLETYPGRRTCTVILKVPNASYESVVAAIKKLGTVKSDRASGSDVTGTYVDLNARLNNLKATETRLADITSRATSTEDVLAVEKEMSRVRGDIDSLITQLNTLNDKIDFATITAYITEPQPAIAYDWGIGQSFTDGIHVFVSMIGALIIVTCFLVPVAIYLLLCVVVIYLCYKGWIRLTR